MITAIIQQDLELLWRAFCLGVVLGGCYDGVRAVRRVINHRHWVISIEDFVSWIAVFVICFGFCLAFQSGQLRGVTLLLHLIGFVVYRLSVSRLLLAVASPFLIVLHQLLALLIRPFGWLLAKLLAKIAKSAKKPL